MDIGDLCDFCEVHDCRFCEFGNPCIGCTDYDLVNDNCKSNGACGDPDNVDGDAFQVREDNWSLPL